MSLMVEQWCPTSVQVTVLQARGLRVKGKGGTNDAYAVMQLGKEKYQTSVVEKSVAPAWKEEAAFDLPPTGQGGTMHVHVLHRALVGPDKLLGQAVINLLQLSEDKGRDKAKWFKLLDKTGKADKDRGEVLLDIQFMRNNMTASMFDLSAAGKSRSRLSKFKDKVRGKKKESDSTSSVVPSFTQVLTDSEEEGRGDGDVAADKDEKKKKHKIKSLFSPKSNLQRNMSQSLSVLPASSSLSGSQSSGLNVETSEVLSGKKKFKFKIHKRSGSSDNKDSSSGLQKHSTAEQSNVCINGSHVYCEEPPTRTSHIDSNFTLSSSGHGSMEDVRERQYSAWTEEEEDMADVENIKENMDEEEEEERMRMEEESIRRQEIEIEKRRQEEKEKQRTLEQKAKEQEEAKNKREEEEREKVKEKRKLEEQERRTMEENHKQREEEERTKMEEKRAQEERSRQEEEERVRREEEHKMLEEKRRLEEEERRKAAEENRKEEEERKRREEEEERIRKEQERQQKEEQRAKKDEEEYERLVEERLKLEEERTRIEAEEKVKREDEQKARLEEESRRKQEEAEMVRREKEEQEERRRLEEQERRNEERRKREEQERILKEERAKQEEYDRLAEQKRRQEMEEERIKKTEEEERRQEEKERLEEEERIRKMEQERIKMEEEERRQEEEERVRKEREEVKRLAEEKRRQEEQERLEEEERIRKMAQERIKMEEEERVRKEREEAKRLAEEKRRQEEKERIEEEERIKKREEEKRRKQEEETKRLAEEKRRQEEQERIKEEERIRKMEQERRQEEEERKQEEEERVRKEREEAKRLAEEKRREEMIKEEERLRVEEEKRRQEEEKMKTEREETKRLAEEKRRQEEQERIKEEERIQKREEEKRRQQEEERVRKEREELTRDTEKQNKEENQSKGGAKPEGNRSKVSTERPAEAISTNPFQENPDSDGLDSSTVSSGQERCQSAVSSVQIKTLSSDEKYLIGAQREKRPAPQPPGGNQAERQCQREADVSTRHLAQANKQSHDRDVKTASVLPQRSVSRTPVDTKSTGSLGQSSKGPAPPRPRSLEEEPSSKLTTALASAGNVSPGGSGAKQGHGWNPFEDDEDENESRDDVTASGDANSICRPPQTKVRSSKAARAPPPPAASANVTQACAPQSEAKAFVLVHRSLVQETRENTQEEASVKKDAPPAASRRLQPVKPLNPLAQQAVSGIQGEKDNKSTGILKIQDKIKCVDSQANGAELKGPFSQLTQDELISLVLKQEKQLSERDRKISELEQYIDNLLVRVMEEKPSILMSMSCMGKAV